MNVIEIEGLLKRFGKKEALRGVSLSVPEGHIFGFLGPNGAGKTTTIKILLGLMKKDGGFIKLFGDEVKFPDTGKNGRIGFVPETFSLYGYMSGWKILKFNGALYGKDIVQNVEHLQRIFNLPLGDKVSTYSMGMKKLLSFYIAFSTEPDLLVLDEPTDGLDPLVRKKLLSFIVDDVAERGTTVFFSSHIISEVEKVADTVGILKKGRIVLQGELDLIKENSGEITFRADKNVPVESERVGENIYRYVAFGNKSAIVEKLKKNGNVILSEEPVPFEEIFVHFTEEKYESTAEKGI